MNWGVAATAMLIVDGVLVMSYVIWLYMMRRLFREQLDIAGSQQERSPPQQNDSIFHY